MREETKHTIVEIQVLFHLTWKQIYDNLAFHHLNRLFIYLYIDLIVFAVIYKNLIKICYLGQCLQRWSASEMWKSKLPSSSWLHELTSSLLRVARRVICAIYGKHSQDESALRKQNNSVDADMNKVERHIQRMIVEWYSVHIYRYAASGYIRDRKIVENLAWHATCIEQKDKLIHTRKFKIPLPYHPLLRRNSRCILHLSRYIPQFHPPLPRITLFELTDRTQEFLREPLDIFRIW